MRVGVDEKKDQYDTAIWIADADGSEPPRALTSGTRDTAPRWSPDGRRLAFVRAVEKDGRPQPPQIYVHGDGRRRSRAPSPTCRAAPATRQWSPDGRTIAFSSTARPDELPGSSQTGQDRQAARERRARDHRGRLPRQRRRRTRASSIADRPSHIWTVAVPGNPRRDRRRRRRMTSGEFAAGNHQWSPDGRAALLRLRSRVASPYYYRRRQRSLLGGEGRRRAAPGGEHRRHDRRLRVLAATASASPSSARCRTASRSARTTSPISGSSICTGGTPRNLTAAYDFDIGGGLGGDQRAPRGAAAGRRRSGAATAARIFVRVGEQGNANLKRVDAASGKVDAVTTGSARRDGVHRRRRRGQKFAVVLSTPTVLGDLARRRRPRPAPRRGSSRRSTTRSSAS